jgi:hypothetical protein|tara:strand:+ start:72 stop:494 length:423 start_codon:yes stop_codon:yes gene_type:complete
MKLIKKTKQGNLHFILSDGRIGAVYPITGYVRVSHSMKGFAANEQGQRYLDKQRQRNIDAINSDTTGSIKMYQINPTRKVTTMHETDEILWYRTGKGWACFVEYPRPAYYAIHHTERVKYPNNLAKLTELLNNFEKNNCL